MFVQRAVNRLYIVGKLRSGGIRSRKVRHSTTQWCHQTLPMSTMAAKPIVAIGQMRATNDKAANMQQVEQLVADAKERDVKMLFLPECCDFVGESRSQTLELSETLDGPTMQRYQELAQRNEIWLSLGGIHESSTDENVDKVYNAHVLLDCTGQIVQIYRKLHLFDVETPEFKFRESTVVIPGPRIGSPCDTPIGKLGLQICYDVRFAESSLLLRKWGAQILTYPSAFAYTTGKAHWETLLRARAIENQCYVIAPAQIGYHNDKRRSWGHAMMVDPWGKVVADCGGENELAIATAEIDLSVLENVRKNMPCFEHRRGNIYSLTAYAAGTADAQTDRAFATHTIQKETIFYETEHSFAFTNIRCVVEGHVLVATKRITPRLNGLTCEEMTDLFATVCKIQRMLETFYKTSAATVTVQDGKAAGQTVPHVHFHVMPRQLFDFGHNDQIYVKLDDRCENKPDRAIDERIEEARIYRALLRSEI